MGICIDCGEDRALFHDEDGDDVCQGDFVQRILRRVAEEEAAERQEEDCKICAWRIMAHEGHCYMFEKRMMGCGKCEPVEAKIEPLATEGGDSE